MAKSQESFSKKEKEKQRLRKRQDKQLKRDERKISPKKSGLQDMIAYVDEYGNITDTPPDLSRKKVIRAEDIEIGVPKRVKEDLNVIRSGKVEFFNHEKGFGFIKENETNEKYFVHISSLTEEIEENDTVLFEVEQGQKGWNAVRVKRT
jgi:cold shock CspA family protein